MATKDRSFKVTKLVNSIWGVLNDINTYIYFKIVYEFIMFFVYRAFVKHVFYGSDWDMLPLLGTQSWDNELLDSLHSTS